jgi:flagellar biosynthesis/type III secretory pathway protein FliH
MTWEDVIEYEKRDSYEDGKKSGLEQGLEQGINALVSACREFGKSNDEIVAILMEKFSLTEDEATNKVTNN